ncbi:MAG: DUF3142 domain-containing protein [Candidatus Hydrogenedentes bacterium]|nr:DUF3142 domain-containing protein [Candidatus Hydrogenedentota bacterium]
MVLGGTRLRRGVGILAGIAVTSVVVAALWLHGRLYDEPRPLPHAYYVWQMQWTDSVRDAVARAAPEADRLMVLLGEVSAVDGALAFTPARPDWQSLARDRAQTALVLRAGVSLGPFLNGTGLDGAADYLFGILDGARNAARDAGVEVVGVQLDYDCPTSKLGDYRRLLEAMQSRLPDVDLSITVLPTWIKRWEFGDLVDGLSYYVLQVHSLEPPTTVDQPIVLCDTSRIPGYLRRAAWVGVPFYLALPTYGYRVVFDESGAFTALSAEGPAPAANATHQVRLVMPDPAEIAAVVRSVEAAPPRGCRGFAWFRLPNLGDELNWSWTTLEAVREGRVPRTAFDVEIRNLSPALYEAWITNTGETRVWDPIAFEVRWNGKELLAYDVLGGFAGAPNRESESVRLTGPPPHDADPAMVAWFRFGDGATETPSQVVAGPVTVLQSQTADNPS